MGVFLAIHFDFNFLILLEMKFFAWIKSNMCQFGGILPWWRLKLTFLSFTIKLYLEPYAEPIDLSVL